VEQCCSSKANLRLNTELNVIVALCICGNIEESLLGKSKNEQVSRGVAVKAKLSLMLEANFAKFHRDIEFSSTPCSALFRMRKFLMADGLSILHYGFLVLALARAAGAHSGLGSSKEFSANVLREFLFRHHRCSTPAAARTDD